MRTESWSVSSSKSVWGDPLPRAFYGRDTRQVARDLLGKVLVVRAARPRAGLPRELAARIVETEAYRGDDPASHSARGPTPRSAIMFGPPGVAYVYFIYGMYEMLNFVTERDGFPGAVLIRGATLIPPEGSRSSAAGPGRLTRALGIRMRDNAQPLLGPRLSVHDGGAGTARVMASPRVGIRVGRERFWRYFLDGNPGVSRSGENAIARPWKSRED